MKKLFTLLSIFTLAAPCVLAQAHPTHVSKQRHKIYGEHMKKQPTPEVLQAEIAAILKEHSSELTVSDDIREAVEVLRRFPEVNAALFKLYAQENEVLSTVKVLQNLESFRADMKQTRGEEPLEVLQKIVSLYDVLAAGFAANADTEHAFVAKNQQIVKIIAQEIQKPVQTGWGKDLYIGAYIAKHLPAAYQSWTWENKLEFADKLDSFNRDVLFGVH